MLIRVTFTASTEKQAARHHNKSYGDLLWQTSWLTVTQHRNARDTFAIEEQEPENVREACGITMGGGYGHPEMPEKADFDEVAPAYANTAKAWITEVLNRRAGIELLEEDR